jgi:hypothetical protein
LGGSTKTYKTPKLTKSFRGLPDGRRGSARGWVRHPLASDGQTQSRQRGVGLALGGSSNPNKSPRLKTNFRELPNGWRGSARGWVRHPLASDGPNLRQGRIGLHWEGLILVRVASD